VQRESLTTRSMKIPGNVGIRKKTRISYEIRTKGEGGEEKGDNTNKPCATRDPNRNGPYKENAPKGKIFNFLTGGGEKGTWGGKKDNLVKSSIHND